MYCIVAFFQAIVARQGFDFVTMFSKTEKTPQILSQLLSQDNFRTGETIKEAGQGFENRFRVSAEDGGGVWQQGHMQEAGAGPGQQGSHLWGKLLQLNLAASLPPARPCVPGQLGKSGHQEARLGPN